MAPSKGIDKAKTTMAKAINQLDFVVGELGQTTLFLFKRAGALACAGTVLIAVAGLLGYVPGLRVLGSFRWDYIPMAPTTAGCFLVLSAVLFCQAQKRRQGPGLIAMVALVLVAMGFCLMEAIQPFNGIELEDWLYPPKKMFGAIPVGRMSPVTGVGFLVAGLGTFLLLQRRNSSHADRTENWSSSLGVVTVLLGTTVLLAYLYGTPLLYGSSIIPMAATTAFGFIFLGVALIAVAGPECLPTRLFLGSSTSARLSRVFVPLTLAAVLLQSVLSRFLSASFIGHEPVFLAVLVTVVAVVTMSAVARVAHSMGGTLDEFSQKLQESETRFRSLTNLSSDYYWETDTEHRIVQRTESHNKGAGDSLFSLRSPIGRRRWEIPYLSPDESGWREHQAMLDAHLPFREFVFSRLTADGFERHVSISGDPVFDAAGEFRGYRGVGADITERKRMEEQVRQLAFYDELTKLPNRRLLNDRLSQTMAANKRSGRYGAMMFLDLDNFKPLNDAHGHGVGDLLLIEAANRLKRSVRAVDTVARFGGDEFVVIISELGVNESESVTQARIIAQKIGAVLAKPYVLQVQHQGVAETTVEHQCTASIGVALFNRNDASQEDVLRRADMVMYQAKEEGHNLIRFWEPST